MKKNRNRTAATQVVSKVADAADSVLIRAGEAAKKRHQARHAKSGWRTAGKVALVLGAGTIGTLAALLLRLQGLQVHVYSRGDGGRGREVAERAGAAFVSADAYALDEQCAAEFGPLDIIIEATGHSPLAFAAMDAAGFSQAGAQAISADGSVIVGWSGNSSSSGIAVRWIGSNGSAIDALGTLAFHTAAEALAGARTKPKRSVLFVWHTAEELGLFGANLPEEYGCAGLNNVAYGLIMQ